MESQGARQFLQASWLKVHIVVDSKTGEIVDLIVTPSGQGDITVGVYLLANVSGKKAEILADGAYDGDKFRRQAFEQGVKTTIPPPKNGKTKRGTHLRERNDAIRLIESLGGDDSARSLWGKLTGYNHRVKVESAFSRLKRLFGDTVFSRDLNAQFVKAWMSNFWLNLNYA